MYTVQLYDAVHTYSYSLQAWCTWSCGATGKTRGARSIFFAHRVEMWIKMSKFSRYILYFVCGSRYYNSYGFTAVNMHGEICGAQRSNETWGVFPKASGLRTSCELLGRRADAARKTVKCSTSTKSHRTTRASPPYTTAVSNIAAGWFHCFVTGAPLHAATRRYTYATRG